MAKGRTTNDEDSQTNNRMKKNDVRQQVHQAIAACQDKKAEEISILEMEKGTRRFHRLFRGVQRDQSPADSGHR